MLLQFYKFRYTLGNDKIENIVYFKSQLLFINFAVYERCVDIVCCTIDIIILFALEAVNLTTLEIWWDKISADMFHLLLFILLRYEYIKITFTAILVMKALSHLNLTLGLFQNQIWGFYLSTYSSFQNQILNSLKILSLKKLLYACS